MSMTRLVHSSIKPVFPVSIVMGCMVVSPAFCEIRFGCPTLSERTGTNIALLLSLVLGVPSQDALIRQEKNLKLTCCHPGYHSPAVWHLLPRNPPRWRLSPKQTTSPRLY